jgi:hypothetical protein
MVRRRILTHMVRRRILTHIEDASSFRAIS